MCMFLSSSACFMKFDVPIFGVYVFIIAISSCWIIHVANMKWPSLSLLTSFDLKSALSDTSIAILICFQTPFVW
jgi:hypothetical protein